MIARERPDGGFELWAWLFMRLSGVALLLLALGHLGIMHLVNPIDTIDFSFVAARYRGWGWRVYDLALLLLALLHGMNGLRTVADDFFRDRARRAARLAVGILAAVFAVLGSWVILFFKPPAA